VFIFKSEVFVPILNWIRDNKPIGIPCLFLLYILWVVCCQTHSVLDLCVGVIFGILDGFFIGLTGTFLGTVTSFLLGRTLLKNWTEKLVTRKKKFAMLNEALKNKRNAFQLTVIARLALPSQLVNYGLSITQVPFPIFAIASLVGMSPWVIQFVIIGNSVTSISDALQGIYKTPESVTIMTYTFFGVLLIGAVIAIFFARRKWRQITLQVEQQQSSLPGDQLTSAYVFYEAKPPSTTQQIELIE